jgi:hypothetical protein
MASNPIAPKMKALVSHFGGMNIKTPQEKPVVEKTGENLNPNQNPVPVSF